MSEKKILFFGFNNALPAFRETVDENAGEEYTVLHWNDLSEEERSGALAQADYFMVLGQRITREMMVGAPKLRYIQRTGQGYDNVDVDAARELGIPVAILPTGNAIAVAEHSILLPLALFRKLIGLNEDTKKGEWPAMKYRTTSFEMDGKTHGFIGFGNIGRLTARRSKAFNTRIVYYDVVRAPAEVEEELGAEYLPMDELLRQSDIVSLHMPLLPSTRGIIGAEQLRLMKPTAVLINTARGGLVDEEALCQALEDGVIAGAGLDTFSTDPIPAGSRILSFDNVIATPHVAGGTMDTFLKQAKGALECIEHVENGGDPSFVVNGVQTAR